MLHGPTVLLLMYIWNTFCWTLSLLRCHLKTTNESAKSETSAFLSSFSHWHVKAFSLKCITMKVDCYRTRKYTVCIFQPRNFTGWGSEGVNAKSLIWSFYFDLFYSLAGTHFEKACCFFKYSAAFSACPWSRTWSFCFFPRCFCYEWKTGVKYLIHSFLYLWSFPGFCCAYIIFISENLSDYIRGVEM